MSIFSGFRVSHIVSVVLFLLTSLALPAQWTTNEIEVDGTPVKLVLPGDYVKAPDDDVGLVQSRKILKEYLVFANYRSGSPWQFVQVQMHASQRDYRYTRESFASYIGQTKSSLPDFNIRELRVEFQKRVDEISANGAKLVTPVVFPISSESERHFIIPALFGMDHESAPNGRVVAAVASVTISLNGRMLMLQVFSPYQDKDSVSQVSALGKEIAERTLAVNR